MAKWTTSQLPPQQGRSAVVTGTGGLGFETALQLAQAGADVIVAGRDRHKGQDAIARIRAATRAGTVRFEQVDLANLESVADFGRRLRSQCERLDVVINNAAVMTPPERRQTADGFELQFGTNYLGHFALTAHLMPLLRKGTDPRVVTVASIAAKQGAIHFDDLQAQASYDAMRAYSQSKLACLIFAFSLQRRSAAEGWGVSSVAAHPGISRTNLLYNGSGRGSRQGLMRTYFWFLFQPVAQGALPLLYAAASPDAQPGAYYGPDRLQETRGYPALSKVPEQATDRAAAERLWLLSEQLTGVTFPTWIPPFVPVDTLSSPGESHSGRRS